MGTRIWGPRRFRNRGHDWAGESKYVRWSMKRSERRCKTLSFRGCGVEILKLLLPPRLGHPYQSERGVNNQCPGNREVSKPPPTQSRNPPSRDAFPPRGMPRELNAHSFFGCEDNMPISRAHRSILILQQVSGHKSTRHACLSDAKSNEHSCWVFTLDLFELWYGLRTSRAKRSRSSMVPFKRPCRVGTLGQGEALLKSIVFLSHS